LKFLSKPRFAHEVAEHFRMSKKLANFHLREAVKSGQVLVSEKPIQQTWRSSDGKLRRLKEILYVSRKSPMLIDGRTKFRTHETNELVQVGFLSKNHALVGKSVFNNKLSSFTFEETTGLLPNKRRFKTKGLLKSEFAVNSAKAKLAKRRTVAQLLRRKPQPIQENVKSLSYVEKIHLFQALLKEPLAFLDLHVRFGVSKQTIRRLVKNRLLTEIWGPKAVGVRFKLSKKGENYLRQLEAAAKYEPKIKENPLIRLKHRISI